MNHPSGFRLRRRQGRRRRTRWTALFGNTLPLARAHAHVPRRLHRHRLPVAGAYAVGAAARALGPLRAHRAGDPADDRRARLARAGARRRLGRARRRRAAAGQARRVRGPRAHDQAAPPSTSSAGTTDDKVKYGIEIPQAAVAARLPQPRTRPCRASTRCRRTDRPPVNVVRFAFQTMVGIGTLLALLGVCLPRACASRRRRLPESRVVLPRASRSPGRCRSSR